MKEFLPKPIRKGDTIRLICPSGAIRTPDSLPRSVQTMEEMGFKVQVGEGCLRKYGYFGGTDEERAREVENAFMDDNCDAIVCIRGGYGTARCLSQLRYDLIAAHPKRFFGFSDITALHQAIHLKTGMITFHSPMPGYLTRPEDQYTRSYFMQAMTEESIEGTLKNPENDPAVCVQGGVAEGRLSGGNLSLVASLIGTPWEPDYTGKILMLEDVNEHTYRVDGMLSHLRNAGVFEKCAGVCLGQFTDCDNEDDRFGFTLRQIVEDLVVPAGKPVMMNMRFGHCTPTFTFPVGVKAVMNANFGIVSIENEEIH